MERNLKNWYEIVGTTFKKLKDADETFRNLAYGEKRSAISSLGYNQTILDKTICFTPYPWLEPIKKFNSDQKGSGSKVITKSDRIKMTPKGSLFTLAEETGFEPARAFRPNTLSRRAP